MLTMITLAAFMGASAVINPSEPVTYVTLGSFLAFGTGGILIPVSTIATIACPEDLIGTAVALTAAVRTLGGAVGQAILDSILLDEGKKKVPKSNLSKRSTTIPAKPRRSLESPSPSSKRPSWGPSGDTPNLTVCSSIPSFLSEFLQPPYVSACRTCPH